MTLKARIRAIDRFVKGLKEDNIYTDINACCVMAGWDSLAGALTPLKGTAPTNSGFLDADLDRGIGLKGNGSTKYLNSNRAGNADGQNDRHVSVFLGDRGTAGGGARYIASGSSASYDTFINNLSAGSVISAVSNPSYDTVAYSGGGFLGRSDLSPLRLTSGLAARPRHLAGRAERQTPRTLVFSAGPSVT